MHSLLLEIKLKTLVSNIFDVSILSLPEEKFISVDTSEFGSLHDQYLSNY